MTSGDLWRHLLGSKTLIVGCVLVGSEFVEYESVESEFVGCEFVFSVASGQGPRCDFDDENYVL